MILISEYEKNGIPKNFVDHVFGGEMTSTVMCQQCKTVRIVDKIRFYNIDHFFSNVLN